jgi:hypothetical protein
MTIKIYNDRIEFGNYILRESDTGFTFDGKITANTISNSFQGTVQGFTYSGNSPALPTGSFVLDKFLFSSDSVTAVSHGTLTVNKTESSGQSSTTNGYATGGVPPAPLSPAYNTIHRFPFVTTGDSIDAADLTTTSVRGAGQSSSISGYHTQGTVPATNLINKFPFATDLNATDIGNLVAIRQSAVGHSSLTDGYTAGGFSPPSPTIFSTIERFPFSTDTNATSVGNLTQARRNSSGQSSFTRGYTTGGIVPGVVTTIDSFLFSSLSNIVDVGDLTQGRIASAGQSSTTHGYNSGGRSSPTSSTVVTTIYRFPFSTSVTTTDIGNLSQARDSASGQQV